MNALNINSYHSPTKFLQRANLTTYTPLFSLQVELAPMGGASIGAGGGSYPPLFLHRGGQGYINSLQLFNNTTCLQSCNVVFPALRHSTAIITLAYIEIRYDRIGEFNVDSKAEYSALSSTRSQKKKLKQTTPVHL